MDRFHLMTVFVAVAEQESFAAGARKLGMSPPAVTRAIASLEARLGIHLLTRTTRYVRATDSGLRYLEHARRIIAEADEADEAAAGIHADPRGQLAVTAPVLFGRMFVMPSMVSRHVDFGSVHRPDREPSRGRPGCGHTNRRTARFDDESDRRRPCAPRGVCVAGLPQGAWHAEKPRRPCAAHHHRRDPGVCQRRLEICPRQEDARRQADTAIVGNEQ